MLNTIRIENFALIEETEIEFTKGLNIISGETGAGKSILMKALALVLGARGRAELVREGAEKASVEAHFDLNRESDVLRKLTESGLQSGDELVIRRQLTRNGRSTSYVNGSLVTAQMLSYLTSDLVDISGQHAHYSLLRTEQHLATLDRLCQLESLSAEVEAQYAQLAAVSAKIEDLKEKKRNRSDREAFLQFQLIELREANLSDENEEEELEAEAKRLRNLERIQSLAHSVSAALYDQNNSATDLVSQANRAIDELSELDDKLTPLAQDLATCSVLIEESYRAIVRYRDRLEGEPERLTEVEERLSQLSKLRQKYGLTLKDVMVRRDELETELTGLSGNDELLVKASAERDKLAQTLLNSAKQLSAARRAGGAGFIESVQQELGDLGMNGARLELKFSDQTSGLVCDHQFVGPKGLEHVEFLMATNEGERVGPLNRIASGGELSRIMLAVKQVMAKQDPVDVYVFDEVDAGVGGQTAEMIGQKLAKVAEIRQAICVTHLAQIAAMGDHHFAVSKKSKQGRTFSLVTPLNKDDRVVELTRMLGGSLDSDVGRSHAQELLERSVRP